MDEPALKISNVMSVKLGRDDIYTEYYIVFNNIIVSINFTSLLEAESAIITVSSNLPDGSLSK